jgi:hypothetical protein
MEAKRINPHRWLPYKLALVALCVYLILLVIEPTEAKVTGAWVSDSDSGLVTLDLRSDGTFVQTDQGQQISVGRWRLIKRFQFFRSMELSDSFRLPVDAEDLHQGKGAMVYPILYREGRLCLRTREDSVYWCKSN